ncbi:CSMD2-like protein, partial [Mya arenaria]
MKDDVTEALVDAHMNQQKYDFIKKNSENVELDLNDWKRADMSICRNKKYVLHQIAMLILLICASFLQLSLASRVSTSNPKHGNDLSAYMKLSAFPPSIPFGHVSINVTIFTVGSTVFYNCDEGYIRVGNEFASCQTDGSWTDQPECKLPQPPYRNGAVVIYACLPGFSRTHGNDNAITCMPDGSWEGAPACIP